MNAVPLPFGHQYGDQDVEILAGGLQYRVSLKAKPLKDTPFSNLTPTSMLPTNYASIFRAKVDPQEKANRLKIALRRDNIQLMAYFLMLASLGSLAFFQAAKGSSQHLSAFLLVRLRLISSEIDRPVRLQYKARIHSCTCLANVVLSSASHRSRRRFLVRCCE